MTRLTRTAGIAALAATLCLGAAAWTVLGASTGFWEAGDAALASTVPTQDTSLVTAPYGAYQEDEEGAAQDEGNDDRNTVMLVTAGAAATALVLASIGYALRKAYGIQIVPGPGEESHAGGHH